MKYRKCGDEVLKEYVTTEKAEKAEEKLSIPAAVIPEGQALRRSGGAVWNLLITAEGFERGFATEKQP